MGNLDTYRLRALAIAAEQLTPDIVQWCHISGIEIEEGEVAILFLPRTAILRRQDDEKHALYTRGIPHTLIITLHVDLFQTTIALLPD